MVVRTTTILAVFFLFALFAPFASANQYGDVSVQISPPPTAERLHGYTEYRVSLANLSPRDRHTVKLTLPENSYFGGTVTRTITIEPSSTLTVSLFTSIALGGNGLGVEIDGQPQRDVIQLNLTGYGYEFRPAILISQGASSRTFPARAASFLKNAEGKEAFTSARPERAVAEWSTNWLGYSSYDGVVVSADEMRSMPEPVASAIWRYVECGGSLLVIGTWQVPKAWQAEKEQDGALATYNAGFGQCMVGENGVVEGLTKDNWDQIGEVWNQSESPWMPSSGMAFDFASANKVLPVMENVSVPVRGLLLIILVFVVVIGPVNLFLLAKWRRKMWLLWTVPVISLVTCVAVSAYSLFSEGWGGRARYLSFTILDERTHRASTIGINAFYSPLTPGDGLRYGTETEITSQSGGWNFARETGFRTADWTEGQHLETGWVTARTPAHFMIRRSETRRERLTLTRRSDGTLSVVNGLGVTIRNLWLADEKGAVYNLTGLAAGASATLTSTREHAAITTGRQLRNIFQGDWVQAVQRGARFSDLLRPGTYVVDLDTCPFLEEGLRGASRKKSEALVYGIMKGPGDED